MRPVQLSFSLAVGVVVKKSARAGRLDSSDDQSRRDVPAAVAGA